MVSNFCSDVHWSVTTVIPRQPWILAFIWTLTDTNQTAKTLMHIRHTPNGTRTHQWHRSPGQYVLPRHETPQEQTEVYDKELKMCIGPKNAPDQNFTELPPQSCHSLHLSAVLMLWLISVHLTNTYQAIAMIDGISSVLLASNRKRTQLLSRVLCFHILVLINSLLTMSSFIMHYMPPYMDPSHSPVASHSALFLWLSSSQRWTHTSWI